MWAGNFAKEMFFGYVLSIEGAAPDVLYEATHSLNDFTVSVDVTDNNKPRLYLPAGQTYDFPFDQSAFTTESGDPASPNTPLYKVLSSTINIQRRIQPGEEDFNYPDIFGTIDSSPGIYIDYNAREVYIEGVQGRVFSEPQRTTAFVTQPSFTVVNDGLDGKIPGIYDEEEDEDQQKSVLLVDPNDLFNFDGSLKNITNEEISEVIRSGGQIIASADLDVDGVTIISEGDIIAVQEVQTLLYIDPVTGQETTDPGQDGANEPALVQETNSNGDPLFTSLGAKATATIAFSGTITAGKSITIIDHEGNDVTYTASNSENTSQNKFDSDASAAATATSLKNCIEATVHLGKITVAHNGSGTLTLTQSVEGPQGNKPITTTILSNVTITRFSGGKIETTTTCLLYTSPSPRDNRVSRMPSSA